MASLGDTNKTTDSDRPESVITDETTGDRAGVTAVNRLKVDALSAAGGVGPNDFFLEIARGNVPGFSQVNKFGHNDVLSSGAYEDIWDQSIPYTFPASASTVNVKSTDADDTSAGTGARTLKLEGLDASYDEISETITMNGTTDVTSSNSYLRLHRMMVETIGSSDGNEGYITATHGSDVIAAITEGFNQTLMAIYTIPSGITGYIWSYYFTTENQQSVAVRLRTRKLNETFQSKHHLEIATSFDYTFVPPVEVLQKTDIRMEGLASTGSTSVAGGFNIILIDN